MVHVFGRRVGAVWQPFWSAFWSNWEPFCSRAKISVSMSRVCTISTSIYIYIYIYLYILILPCQRNRAQNIVAISFHMAGIRSLNSSWSSSFLRFAINEFFTIPQISWPRVNWTISVNLKLEPEWSGGLWCEPFLLLKCCPRGRRRGEYTYDVNMLWLQASWQNFLFVC